MKRVSSDALLSHTQMCTHAVKSVPCAKCLWPISKGVEERRINMSGKLWALCGSEGMALDISKEKIKGFVCSLKHLNKISRPENTK